MPINWRLLPFIFLAFLEGHQESQGEKPSWLFSLSTPDGIVLAIGHAPRYVDTQRGFKEARESGYLKLAFQFMVHVEHRLADVQATGLIGSREYTSVTTDPVLYERVQNASVALDSTITEDGTYILLAAARDHSDLTFDIAQLRLSGAYAPKDNLREPPSWTRSLAATQTSAAGFGTGYRIIGENEYLAMKDALINLAASRSIQQSSLSRLYQDDYTVYDKILSEAEVDTIIYSARITKRWYDQNSGSYYIMISTE